MADELIDVCDELNNLTGKHIMKSEAHALGIWHRAAHVWIYTSTGEILLQQRSFEKDYYPGYREVSASGHIGAGEDITTAALRETKEELGLSLEASDLEFIMIRKTSKVLGKIKNNEFKYIYLTKFDGDISSLQIQKEEVACIKLISIDTLAEELLDTTGLYTAHGEYWFEMIEEVKKRLEIST